MVLAELPRFGAPPGFRDVSGVGVGRIPEPAPEATADGLDRRLPVKLVDTVCIDGAVVSDPRTSSGGAPFEA